MRRGVWLPPDVWSGLSADDRYAALVFATLLTCREPERVVLSGYSAAVVWGLPTIGAWPAYMQVHDPDDTIGPSRHIRPQPGAPTEVAWRLGAHVTPPARTVIDLARCASLETAVAAADHALRTGLCTTGQLEAEASSLVPGVRGRGAARLTVDLADGLSGSPGESLSRVQMFRGNFPRPVLQRRYSDERGLIGYVDFDMPGLIGEFDGRNKYRVPEGASPEEAGEIVWAEKQREDRLRRHKTVARWIWSTALDTGALARLLISHGLRPEPRQSWIPVGGGVRPRT